MRRVLLIIGLLGSASALLGAQNPPPAPAQTQAQVKTPNSPTDAQQAAAMLGKNLSNEQIAGAIKQSGLSEQQVRDRLRQAGYDPALADPFFSKTTGDSPSSAPQTSGSADAFVRALVDLGIMKLGENSQETESTKDTPKEEAANRTSVVQQGNQLFGKEVFSSSNSSFDPVNSGPVDPSYRVGIGDQLQLVVTGQVELAYSLDIRRDGTLIVPQVGQIAVAGLTLDAARAVLRARMARSYNGLASGDAQLDLTISRIRSNSIFVIGEVENPGSYQVNALATVFYALARAGGPNARGTFRKIEVRRAGQVIRTIDLYDYLLRGDASNDIRTEQGDIIFVPLNTRSVSIRGAVRRPAVYELKPGENLANLVEFAGGLLSSAALDRIQVDRVLPPEQRSPGFERVKVDVRLAGRTTMLTTVGLFDSDEVTVFSVGELRRNTVTIAGAVFQPGEYELTPGMTLDSLLTRAAGLLPWSLSDRIKIRRNVVATGRSENFSLDIRDSTARHFALTEYDQIAVLDGRMAYPAGTIVVAGAVRTPFEGAFVENSELTDAIDLANGFAEYAMPDRIKVERTNFETGQVTAYSIDFRSNEGRRFALERNDRITVLDARTAYPARIVSVEGAVVAGGTRTFALNQTLSDAIQLAGGFREEAQSLTVARRKFGPAYNDTTSTVLRYELTSTKELPPEAQKLVLLPDDRIMVRAAPGYRRQVFVTLEGEFVHPGRYPITENRDRLREIVTRSGGTLPAAYANSFRLTRSGAQVVVDFEKAIRGASSENVLLRDGDVLSIGQDPRTVAVKGAVTQPSLIVYRPNLRASQYVELAGGPTERGTKNKATVEYPSGYSRRTRSFLGVRYYDPEVQSGSVITVPEKRESTGSSNETWARILGTTSALASLLVAYAALRR